LGRFRFVTATAALLAAAKEARPTAILPACYSCAIKMSTEVTAIALYDYDATDSDELSVRKGETLVLLESYDDGWWLMQKGRAAGLVPSNYMETKNATLTEQHNEESEQSRSRNPSGDRQQQHKKEKKVDKKTQPELAQLKTLRDEAEDKLNKLR
jgi:hypothetical protein